MSSRHPVDNVLDETQQAEESPLEPVRPEMMDQFNRGNSTEL